MAFSTQITGRLFPPIGLIGQTVGFQPFTPQEIASDGHIQTIVKTFSFEVLPLISGETNPNQGIVTFFDEIIDKVESYLDTIFTDVSKTYSVLINVLDVKRQPSPISGVRPEHRGSMFVDKRETYITKVNIQIAVT